MTANVMDGRGLSEAIKESVKHDVSELNSRGVDVGLAMLLCGDNPASRQYFMATLKACKGVGITAYEYRLPGNASVNEVLNTVHSINTDERINGLLMLMPLPPKINPRRVVNAIVPEKDIDGLGAISVGRLAAEESTFQLFSNNSGKELMPAAQGFLPCTPFGVIRLLNHHNVDIKGKHAVVVGKSLAVGKPLSLMLLAREATVTVCHRETKNLTDMLRQADIVCTATGRSGLITGDKLKEGAVVVDIGINVMKDGRITGDVDFDSASQKASLITPVPGGVGPVTIAMLLENTVRSARFSEALHSPLLL